VERGIKALFWEEAKWYNGKNIFHDFSQFSSYYLFEIRKKKNYG